MRGSLIACNGVSIEDVPVDGLQEFMVRGQLTSRDLVECYLARIEQTNSFTHSISEVNPDALSIADGMDAERRQGNVRGPLHGIPFLVKDNYYTDDKHNTSEGTLVLLGGRYYSEATATAGSSSGSVVAVRSNQAAIAIGTETYGSLVHPAAQLGLYTVKSTPGLLSRHEVVTGSYYHDTPGPLLDL
ncbi:hypothetical protein LQW54_001881 [Pestalotiopsis sp. IQ-011]